jgi:glyoxylase-like metal-dependent hydrolase (beta-lactamase superfamily II)
MTEGELAELGVHRIPVPIPFPQAGGPVNVYVVEEAGGGLLLFDSGLGTEVAHAAIEAGFARVGRRLEEITRIVVSHGHVDHYGGARFIQARHGGELPVFGHPADEPKMSERGPRWQDLQPHYAAHLARLGVPAAEIEAMHREGAKTFGFAPRVPEVRPIDEGEVLRTKHLALRVLHMPGHTPGLLCLHDAEERILLSDDHLMQRISPNPLIELGPDGEEGHFRPLLAYLASIARVRALDLEAVLPGHGAPFSGHREIIDALLGFFAKRQARIEGALARGPATAHEISRAIFPNAPPGQGFLVISETIAHAEVLESRGRIVRSRDGDVYRFALA